MLAFAQNMKICVDDIFWLVRQGYSSWKLETTFTKCYSHQIDLGHKFDTSMSYMLKSLFTNCEIWLVSRYYCMWIVTGATCGAGNANCFRKTLFHSLWGVHDFTHSLYQLYIHYRICRSWNYVYKLFVFTCLFVCLSLTSLCHSNGHIETMPAREINPFTALTRIRSQLLRTHWSTSNHCEWTELRVRPLSHRGWLVCLYWQGMIITLKYSSCEPNMCI